MTKKKRNAQKIRSAKPFELWTAVLPVVKGSSLKCGRRPVIVISEDDYGEQPFVTVIPLTRNLTAMQLPTHVLLCSRFLDEPSRALCEQVTTLDRARLIRRIGYIEEPFDRFAVRRALENRLRLDPMQAYGVAFEPVCVSRDLI